MTLSHVHVAVARVRHDVCRVGQCLRRVSPHAWLAECHQDLALGAELHDDASLVVFAGKLLEILRARRARVSHPHVAVPIDMDAVRPHQHPTAETPDLFA